VWGDVFFWIGPALAATFFKTFRMAAGSGGFEASVREIGNPLFGGCFGSIHAGLHRSRRRRTSRSFISLFPGGHE